MVKAVLVGLCFAHVARLGEAVRAWGDAANSQLDLASEREQGLVVVNTSTSLKIQCRLEIKALEESVRQKVQLPPSSITKLMDNMLDIQGLASNLYGLPTNLVNHDCSSIISNVFDSIEKGWWRLEAWKGQCNSEGSCLVAGLREVGLTADYFTEEDWEGIDHHFGMTVYQYQTTCQASCDYFPDCKQCMEDVRDDKCLLYERQQRCRTRLLTAVLCHCAERFIKWLGTEEYAASLAVAAEGMKDQLRRGSDESGVMNKECKHASSYQSTIPSDTTRVQGIDKTVFAIGEKLYVTDETESLEGAACGPGYSCQPSRVWRNPAVGHYAAPLLVAATYGLMKVAEFTIVVLVSHILCGPGWLACWTFYATSVPGSEVAIAGVVAASKGILSREALACLPTRCVERDGRCEVPGEDPQDWRALIEGVRCRKPASEAEREELGAEAGGGEARRCRLEFCPEGERGNGPQQDGALWHCGGQSVMDPKSSLVAKAKRLQQQKANTCEDDGVDAHAREWFRTELSKYRSDGSGCIGAGMDSWFSGELFLELEDDSTMYALFEATRKQRGYVCARGCPMVPPYLVDKSCMKGSMDPKVFMRGVWKKAARGPLEGCKKAFMKVFLCECAAVYDKPVSSHRLFSQAHAKPGSTLEDETERFEDFLDEVEAAQADGSMDELRKGAEQSAEGPGASR